ncbi:MAG: hypothetical protein MI923_27555 [Phycisphaerales bacterium]|nr:hypothetical protein [Phycisphaerales bacterium]
MMCRAQGRNVCALESFESKKIRCAAKPQMSSCGPDQWRILADHFRKIRLSLIAAILVLGHQSLANASLPVVNTEENANFGRAVAIDGNYAVVGAYLEDSVGANGGAVYVYRYNGSEWLIDARIVPSDVASDDQFGHCVAIEGNTLVAGSPLDDDHGSGSGSAYVFVRSANGWEQQAKLTATDAAAGDSFGFSAAISGEAVVVGAHNWESPTSGTDAGAAYVFRRSGANWNEESILQATDQAASDSFGRAVDIDGNAVVVGAPFKDASGKSNSGKAYVFRNSSGTWSQEAQLTGRTPSLVEPNDRLGESVSISGNRVAAGAPGGDADPISLIKNETGAVYIFNKTGTTWREEQRIVASDAYINDNFSVVDMDGDLLIIGAPNDDDGANGAGSVYIYERSPRARVIPWQLVEKRIASITGASDASGSDVAIDGDRALVGTPNANFGTYPDPGTGLFILRNDAGCAYFFDKDNGGTDNWGESQRILAEVPPPGRCCYYDQTTLTCNDEKTELECMQLPSVWEAGADCTSGCTGCTAGSGGIARRWQAGMSIGFFSEVNLYSGRVVTAIPIAGWSGRGPSVDFTLYHNAACDSAPAHSHWQHTYSTHLEFATGEVIVVSPDNTRDVFTEDSGDYVAPPGIFDNLEAEQAPDTGYVITSKDLSKARFDENGRLDWLEDASGNRLTVHYIDDSQDPADGEVDYIEDAPGRQLNLNYNAHGLLSEVVVSFGGGGGNPTTLRHHLLYYDSAAPNTPSKDADGDLLAVVNDPDGPGYTGLKLAVSFTYNAAGDLATVANQRGKDHDFEYVGHRLVRVTGPTNTVETFGYADTGDVRRTRYTDIRGNAWVTEFGADGNLVRNINPLLFEQHYFYEDNRSQLAHEMTSFQNELGKVWSTTYDDNADILTTTDPLQRRTTYTYDANDNLTSVTPPGATPLSGNAAKKVEIKYLDTNQPTRPTEIVQPTVGGATGSVTIEYYGPDDDCSFNIAGFERDSWNGLIKSVTEANGVVREFDYDIYGHPRKEVENPETSLCASGGGGGYDPLVYPTIVNGGDFNESGIFVSGTTPWKTKPGCGRGTNCGAACGRVHFDGAGRTESSSCICVLFCAICIIPSEEPLKDSTLSTGCGDIDLSATGLATTASVCISSPTTGENSTRSLDMSYDDLDRPLTIDIVSNEPAAAAGNTVDTTRASSISYNDTTGSYTTTGPDGKDTTATLDELGRPYLVTRDTPGGAITEEREFDAASRLTRAIRGNGTEVRYEYFDNNRVKKIRHLDDNGDEMLVLEYAYTPDSLVESITEADKSTAPGHTITATVDFEYDNRNRLTRETRDDSGATGVAKIEYDISYTHDQGGNRKTKTNHMTGDVTTYTYDITDASDGGQHNNRLLYWETKDSTNTVIQKAWYRYGAAGQVDRVVRQTGSSTPEIGWFYYDTSGRLWFVTYGFGDYDELTGDVSNQTFTLASEYRYSADGRQRYLVRQLDPDNDFAPFANLDVWSDHAGFNIYSDYTVNTTTGVATEIAAYSSGLGSSMYNSSTSSFDAPDYAGNDLIGTKRLATDDNGAQIERLVYTAFGELVSSTSSENRYGYGGAWGYERPEVTDALEPWGWLHVGARYYDPSVGRFMQRDPIGMEGGLNVYVYAEANPVDVVDPDGLTSWHPFGVDGPIFGRGGKWGRGPGIRAAWFNRGMLRLGWSWNPALLRNLFSLHGGILGTAGHWHLYFNRFGLTHGRPPLWGRFAVRGVQVALCAAAAYGGWKAGQAFTTSVRRTFGRTGWDMIFRWAWDGYYGVRPPGKGILDY